jgi:molecular chaperone GrpE (heat shock protein)
MRIKPKISGLGTQVAQLIDNELELKDIRIAYLLKQITKLQRRVDEVIAQRDNYREKAQRYQRTILELKKEKTA